MKRKLPRLTNDEAAAKFVGSADLTEYDLSVLKPAHFEFEAKTERINMRLPASLLKAVQLAAARQGIPYQRFIRQVLERAVGPGKS